MDAEAAEVTEDGYFWLGLVFLIGWGILGYFGMYCIHRLNYRRLVGGFLSEETLYRIGWILWVSVFLGSLGETGFLFTGWYEEIGFLLARWDGLIWWGGGGMEGPKLAGSGTGAPPLNLEGRKNVGSGGWHQLLWCCKGAEYLYQSSRTIKIGRTQIVTTT